MTDTITRDEYTFAEHLGAAGAIAALGEATVESWRGLHPDWQGKYWSYTNPDEHGARYLAPINVAARPKNQN
ncbi:hypothetical protein [Nocardia blacklockiae]|uniref:hypothetical protein n=1 Tax=Nocardia blacklockiae TaxID=480036 RepID=UPI001893A518|nr:hypothetical protein [Nocardia blacklockiae]MBF6173598.1 hypothetical protein [Nocardia blacklockiae]